MSNKIDPKRAIVGGIIGALIGGIVGYVLFSAIVG